MPERATGLCVQGVSVIRSGDEHNSIHHNRRDFKAAGVRRVKDPLGAQLGHVRSADFMEDAVPAAGVVTVVGEPIFPNWVSEQACGLHIDGGGNGCHARVLRGQCHNVP